MGADGTTEIILTPARAEAKEFKEQTLAEMVKEFQANFWKGSLLV